MTVKARQLVAIVAVVMAIAWLGMLAVEAVCWPSGSPGDTVLLAGRAAAPHAASKDRPGDAETRALADAETPRLADTEAVSVGACPERLASADPDTRAHPAADPPHVRKIWMRVTAYCPCRICCGRWAGSGRTACGASIHSNGGLFVAADTSLLPFGARVRVPGYADGQFVPVLDRGRVIHGRRLDVFFPTHAQAKQWGVKLLLVEVLGGVAPPTPACP